MMKILQKKKFYDNDTSDNNSLVSSDSNNDRKIIKVHDYYVNNNYKDKDIDSIINSSEETYADKPYNTDKTYNYKDYKMEIDKNDKTENKTELVKTELIKHELELHKSSHFSCNLCGNKSSNNNNNYFILSCDHIYHIQCLADTHFQDIFNYPIIDGEYFSNRKCNICSKKLQLEEIMYLHGKYLSNTKDSIEKHQFSIENFESHLKKIKDELRICYEYKHKLEQHREKSKQIVSILSTMMYN